MDTDKFRAMIADPVRTKPELKQVLINLGDDTSNLAMEVKAVLDSRFPNWARPAPVRGKSRKLAIKNEVRPEKVARKAVAL